MLSFNKSPVYESNLIYTLGNLWFKILQPPPLINQLTQWIRDILWELFCSGWYVIDLALIKNMDPLSRMWEHIKTILLWWAKSKKVKKQKNQSKNRFFINLNFRGAPNPISFTNFVLLLFYLLHFDLKIKLV